MAKRTYKRKNYLILIRFQAKYIAYILLFLYLGALVAGYTVYLSTWVTLGEKLANVYPRARLVYIFKAANWALFWRLVLITPIFIVLGTFISHRIAGPIYRIGKYIDALIQGDYSEGLRLRKKDELKGLASRLTRLCYALREKEEERKQKIDVLIDSINKRDVQHDVKKELETALRDL